MKVFIVAAILVAVASAHDHHDHDDHSMDKMTNPKMTYLHDKLKMIREKLNITYNATANFNIIDMNNDDMWSEDELVDTYMKNVDRDGDMKINATEYITALVMSGMPQDAAVYMFYRGDNNTDNELCEDELKLAFMGMDANHDKSVSLKEFKTSLATLIFDMGARAMLREAVHQVFHKGDANDDHMHSLEEFKTLLLSMDKDKDSMVSAEEYVTGWVTATNETVKRSTIFFGILDKNMDGMLDVSEITGLFNGMDAYPKDGSLSETEWMGGMTWFAAKIDNKIDMELAMSFMKKDKDMNGGIDMMEVMDQVNAMDEDKDGKLSYREFIGAAMKWGKSRTEALFHFFRVNEDNDDVISMEETKAAFNMTDFNMDGMVEFAEYSLKEKHEMATFDGAVRLAPVMEMMFNSSDSDMDGMLSGDELKASVMKADANGDGKIERDEFVSWWMMVSHMCKQSSEIFFSMIDYKSNDGVFGDDDMKTFFTNMDFNKDNMGSMDEWMNYMLYFYSKITLQMDEQKIKDSVMKSQLMSLGDFDMQAAFNMVDADMDTFVSKAEFSGLYSRMDLDGDNKINTTEFIIGFTKTGMTRDGSLYIFFRMDSNEDQFIEKAEEEETFMSFDVDKDGKVSFAEYSGVMSKIFGELMVAQGMEASLITIYHKLDADMDTMLSSTEMRGLVGAMDADKDGFVSEQEFKTYFVAATGADEDMTAMLFGYFDGDDDGQFGNDFELNGLFTGFDYTDDGMVSEGEFLDSMLFLFARIQKDVEAAQMVKDVIGFFF